MSSKIAERQTKACGVLSSVLILARGRTLVASPLPEAFGLHGALRLFKTYKCTLAREAFDFGSVPKNMNSVPRLTNGF